MNMNDSLFSIDNKIVILTGACGLMGKVLSQALIKRKAKVIMVDIPSANPIERAQEWGGEGFECNVAEEKEVQALCQKVRQHHQKIDILINNHQFKPQGFLEAQAETFPTKLWDDIINVNLKGTFFTCREIGRQMISQKNGVIINFASTYGVVSPNPDLYEDNSLGCPLAYSVSKGGVIMLTKYLASYWGKYGIRVNAITPHGVWNHHENHFMKIFNAKSPMGRLMQPEEIVGAIIFLASNASSYSTGSNLLVEGGWTAW